VAYRLRHAHQVILRCDGLFAASVWRSLCCRGLDIERWQDVSPYRAARGYRGHGGGSAGGKRKNMAAAASMGNGASKRNAKNRRKKHQHGMASNAQHLSVA